MCNAHSNFYGKNRHFHHFVVDAQNPEPYLFYGTTTTIFLWVFHAAPLLRVSYSDFLFMFVAFHYMGSLRNPFYLRVSFLIGFYNKKGPEMAVRSTF